MSDKHEIAKAIAEAIIQAARYANRDANEYSVQTFKNTKISGNQIRQGSIPGFMLKDGSIPSIKIKELDADIARIALAQIQTAEIEYAQIKNVNITTADIKNANIDYARVKDLDADSAYFNTEVFQLGVGGELYIGRLRVRAANIDFLQVGQLVLEDDDGNLHAIGVDADGNMTTKPYEVQYQNISDNAKGLMSEYTIFRGATPPSTPYVGQLWVNTTTEIISRCTQTQPTVKWEPVKASELHTSFIEAVEKGLNILSTGEINILGGGNLNIKSGGNLNVDAMGSVKVASGGKIELASADDLVLNSATGVTVGGYVTNEVSSGVSGFQTQIDGKIETYFGEADPSANWTTPEQKSAAIGDLWFNSTSGQQKLKRWDGTSWEDVNDQTAIDAYATASTAKDTADGKRRVFTVTPPTLPTPPYDIGDLWVQGNNGDIMRCQSAKILGDTASLSHWVKASKYTDDSYASNFVDVTYAADKASFQSQIDGKVETWYYSGAPTATNAPASAWTTTTLKNKHIGDLYYDTASGFVYRYKVVTGTYSWERIKDSDITAAMQKASTASDTADKKRQVFVSTPTTPYNVGDLWTGGPTGDLRRCKVERLTGSYTASDWELASKYTDDTAAAAAAAAASAAQGTANTAATNATSALNQLTDIAADSKLTPVEKKAVKKEWDVIAGEKSKIDAEADEYGVSKTAYGTAYNTLNTYLNGASGLLLNLNTTSNITAATFRTNFTNYYNARQDVLNAITSKAKTLADNAKTAADNAQANLTDFVNNTYTPAISVKNRIWYQPGVPTSSAVNDIWYDTDANPVKIYRANAANVSAIVTSGNGWYDITSVALDQALKGLNSLGNGSYHFFQSSTRPKSAGESGGSQINIGDIWLYTGTSGTKYVNGATYRAVSTNPTTDSGWLAFVAGAVLTPHIALNANHLTLSGESDLTIANPLGGNAIVMDKDGIAIESGSDLTIKDGYGGNAINMDSTGLSVSSTGKVKLTSGSLLEVQTGADIDVKSGGDINVASGGKINLTTSDDLMIGAQNIKAFAETIDLSANESIKLAVSSVHPGGRNLVRNSDFSLGVGNPWTQVGTGTHSIDGTYKYEGKDTLRLSLATGQTSTSRRYQYDGWDATAHPSGVLSFMFWSNYNTRTRYGTLPVATIYCRTGGGGTLEEVRIPIADIPNVDGWSRIVKQFDVPTGTEIIVFVLSVASTNGESNNAWFTQVQLEQGNQVTPWRLADEDPASGVKTSSVEVNSSGIYMDTTGEVDIQTDDFLIKNKAGQPMLSVAASESGGALVLGASNNPIEFGGNFVLGAQNGGLGMGRLPFIWGTVPPSASDGQNGDIYIFHSGNTSGSGWSDTALTLVTPSAQATRFGVTRVWNLQYVSTGYYRIGNGVGDSTFDRGAHFSFTAPAAVKGLTFEFWTAKKMSGSTLSNGVTNYNVVLANTSYSILATGTISATNSPEAPQKHTVTLTAQNNLSSGATYYIGIFYPTLDEGNSALVGGTNAKLKGSTSGGATSGLYVKSNGAWVLI